MSKSHLTSPIPSGFLLAALSLLPLAASPATALCPTPKRVSEPASSSSQQKKELREELARRLAKTASKDAGALYSLAEWAARNGLSLDAKRLLGKVLRIAPDHEKARKKLGYQRYKGKWIKASQLASIKRRDEEAAYKKKGYVKFKGEWIKKDELAYAKLGLVRFEGKWIRIGDRKKRKAGLVPHPRTGTWIKAGDLDKANAGLFPLEQEWVSLGEADAAHKSWENPWILQTDNFRVLTNYDLETADQVIQEAETAFIQVRGLLYNPMTPFPERISLVVFSKEGEYRRFGQANDITGFSAFGCFHAPNHPLKPVAVYYGEKNWGPYYLRHAVGLGASISLLAPLGIPGTSWIHTGFGAYASRFSNKDAAKHFAPQYMAKGGVRQLASFWKSFTISPEQSPAETDWNIYQAGIVISFLTRGTDKKLLDSWDKIRDGIRTQSKKLPRALTRFEKAAAKAEQELRDHLKKLASSG